VRHGRSTHCQISRPNCSTGRINEVRGQRKPTKTKNN
jgi:hypothetical protein